MKRMLALLLCAVMCLPLLVACGPDAPADTTNGAEASQGSPTTDGTNAIITPNTTTPDDTTTTPDNTTTTTTPDSTTNPVTNPYEEPGFTSPENLTIKVDGTKANYTIVYPKEKQIFKSCSEIVLSTNLASSIGSLIGKAPSIGTDSKIKNDSEALEILIGFTDYEETAAVTDELGYGDYIVKAVGNKIVIFGYTTQALEKAVDTFFKLCKLNCEEGIITLTPEKVYRTGTVNKIVNELPVMKGENLVASYFNLGQRDASNFVYQIAIGKLKLEGYSEYCDMLKAAGFETYLETYELGQQNKFSSYTKGEYYVFVGFYEYDNYLRVTIEKNAPTAAFKKTETEKVTTSQIYQLGLEMPDGANNNGNCTFVRLEDGRFVIFDGGFGGTEHIESFVKAIKNQAKKYTTRPVIAAWIVSHSDGDHIHLLRNSLSILKSQHGITVENVFFYKSSEETLENYGASVGAFNLYNFDSIISSAKAVGTTVYKPITGQVCYFSNMKIEFLATPDAAYTRNCFGYDVVCRMILTDTATGKTTSIFNMGDATETPFKTFADHFGDILQSDIVVLAHHGNHLDHKNPAEPYEYYHTGYKLINASVVIDPAGWSRAGKSKIWTYNTSPTITACVTPNFKECYASGDIGDLIIIPVPYVPGSITSTGENKITLDLSNKPN